ncbi:MAG: hypothetical protein VB101_09995 [Rhodospirillaceae bacterium]|nr:hypothetical protein [Rhodospirillaceae bacterium]
MTLPTTISAVTYAGNGATTQFDWTFPIPSGALAVYRTEDNVAVLVDPSAYSVSGLDDPNGGTVSFIQAPALGQTITIKRNVVLTQDVALVTGSAFYAEVVEGAFDHATMQIQQLAEEMGRAVQVPIGSDLDPADYLDAAARSAAAASAAASSAAGSAGAATAAQSGSETARNEAVAAAAAIALPLPVESGGTGATTAAAARANLGIVEAPVGSLLFQSVRETHVQPGYILGNGAPVTETYPELRALYIADGYPYGQDEFGNPLAPNYPGYGLRGWLPGQIVDSGRVWGSKQEDALQGHKHRTPGTAANPSDPWASVDGTEPEARIGPTYLDVATTYRRALSGGAAYSDGIHGAPRVADETRGKNITTVVWIKAYAANTDPGSIDLAQLTNDIQGVSVRTSVLEKKQGHSVTVDMTGKAEVTFSSIPAGVRKIRIIIGHASMPATAAIIAVRPITASGEVSSGYTGSVATIGSPVTVIGNTGYIALSAPYVGNYLSVIADITRVPGQNLWVWNSSGGFGSSSFTTVGGGHVGAGEITGIKLYTGGNLLVSGEVFIEWEK